MGSRPLELVEAVGEDNLANWPHEVLDDENDD